MIPHQLGPWIRHQPRQVFVATVSHAVQTHTTRVPQEPAQRVVLETVTTQGWATTPRPPGVRRVALRLDLQRSPPIRVLGWQSRFWALVLRGGVATIQQPGTWR